MSKKKVLPQYRAQYLTDYFVDYAGNKRMFTLCAISIPVEDEGFVWDAIKNYDYMDDTIYFDEDTEILDTHFTKELRLGMAVQCPDDEPDEKMGEVIAYGKALKYNNHVMLVSHPGMINTMLVDALLKQEAEYFKKNPDSYIAGYNNHKWKYLKQEQVNYECNNLHYNNNNAAIESDVENIKNYLNNEDYQKSL